ncbi:hypothetical protein N7481_006467 [Penicillium waksmanii]|uniref:uncharacterized protein n=1 Tax=Penicillium waksmanii TaxID=69791 RepID=UPI0025483459|nr:uncharacterized protein N7481_006467 [Penicillium waksmanii]KAJ5984368.1 hypothetical protein N7481_006467 [Penicillium waksmanii]
MLSLPFITPRDSHELWFGSSNPYQPSSPHQSSTDPSNQTRRNASTASSHRSFLPSRSPANSLSALQVEERALRLRKQNIASFGYSWIRPAGCVKTMLGMKEEEAEREEALAAAQTEMGAIDGEGIMEDELGLTQDEEGQGEGMERDLDDEIPNADDAEEDIGDEEGYMERDLDDDIPEGYPEDDDYDDSGLYEEEIDEDFDNQPDLDADVPSADEGFQSIMTGSDGPSRDLDDDIPDAAENGSEQEGEWQHTDTEDEEDDEDENGNGDENAEQANSLRPRMNGNFRTSTPNSRGGLPPPPPRRERETDAQRRFINRWSGGGDALDSSSMLFEEDDLRASVTSQSSRRSGFGRRFPRHVGGPRDSLN